MAGRVAGKIKLQSVDELLGVPEIAGTQEIEIGRIHSFPNHPFKVLDDDKMETLSKVFCFINKQRKGNKENFKYTDSSLTKRVKRRENFRLSDCKGRALRKVQEKDSARVKGEAP